MTNALDQPDAATLRDMLHAARVRTLAYAQSLQSDQWLGPYLSIVNPPQWEIGHLAWFQEHWCLRYQPDTTLAPSLLAHADALYNSAIVPHVQRWHLALPAPDQTLGYLSNVLDAVLSRLARDGASAHLRYFVQLAVFHEEMHNEAFDYTRQTLARASEKIIQKQIVSSDDCSGDAAISGGRFMLGAAQGGGFVFDNEKWAHEVEVRPYRMARAAVSNGEFAAFVDDGGYARRELWSDEGWSWRVQADASAPLYWVKQGRDWHARRFDRVLPLTPGAAVIHVNWYEAQAYCRWARRRLPSEAEWEFAAATAPGDLARKRRYPWGDTPPTSAHANLFGGAGMPIDAAALPEGDSAWGVRQMFGNVWEWTADWFNPYPGFVRDPYKEYSEPWFGNHKVLRGGCYATRASLLRNTWRNFYTPDRRDVLAGFRTCAADH
jgi:iron(II)-dependent oxidoreductase